MQTTMLCVVGRVLQRDDVLALAPGVAELGDRRRGVGQQSLAKIGIGPGARDDARAIARADLLFVGLDQDVERGRIDVALLGQQRLERAHAQLGLRQLGMVVIVMVVVIMSAHAPEHNRAIAAVSRHLTTHNIVSDREVNWRAVRPRSRRTVKSRKSPRSASP